jgi:large subunit ribosomal protein L10
MAVLKICPCVCCYFVWRKTVEKSKKPQTIDRINRNFKENDAVFLINQNRMTVANTEDFRKRLRGVNSSYLVCKNTLVRLAVKDTPFECITPRIGGQTAIVFSKDLTGAAKVVQEYAEKSEEKITVLCGGYCEKLLTSAEVAAISKLPSMDELRSKIISVVQAPAQRMAAILQAPASQIARVVQAYSRK